MADAFDLARFAPPADVTFRLRKHPDHDFAVDADPDVDDIARMLRIENVIRGIDGDDSDMQPALEEGKALLLRMIRERDPGFDGDLRIGAQELTVVFALILHGDTVATAILEAITASAGTIDLAAAAQRGREPGGPDDVDREGGAPLPSPELSSEQSLSSDASAAGRQAIGTA